MQGSPHPRGTLPDIILGTPGTSMADRQLDQADGHSWNIAPERWEYLLTGMTLRR